MTCVTRVEEAVEGAMSCADAVSSAQARRPPHRLCVYPWRSAGTAAPGMRERHTYVGKGAVKLSGWQARQPGGRPRLIGQVLDRMGPGRTPRSAQEPIRRDARDHDG
jgi:hypothetical protein